MTWIAWIAILIAAALLLAPAARRGTEALLLAADITGRTPPAALDFRPGFTRRTITYEIATRRHAADLYLPEETAAQAGIVFVPGAAEGGKDDPRVEAFARALARVRFAVLVPDVMALRNLQLLPDSAQDVVDALEWLAARPELVPEGRLGIVTTSVGIGPALLALQRPQWAARVRFFVSIGGYYDLPRTLTYLTTGYYNAHGVTLHTPPREYGKWVYALSNAARLEDAAERAAFERLARRKLAEPHADVRAEAARLGPWGRLIYAFITNTDPARTHELLARLPAQLQADISALNLTSHDLSRLRTRFIIVHGTKDDLIPYGEAVALAEALGRERARLFLLEGFYHVEAAPRLTDAWRLWRAIGALLAERTR